MGVPRISAKPIRGINAEYGAFYPVDSDCFVIEVGVVDSSRIPPLTLVVVANLPLPVTSVLQLWEYFWINLDVFRQGQSVGIHQLP